MQIKSKPRDFFVNAKKGEGISTFEPMTCVRRPHQGPNGISSNRNFRIQNSQKKYRSADPSCSIVVLYDCTYSVLFGSSSLLALSQRIVRVNRGNFLWSFIFVVFINYQSSIIIVDTRTSTSTSTNRRQRFFGIRSTDIVLTTRSETSPTQMLIPWRKYIHIEKAQCTMMISCQTAF